MRTFVIADIHGNNTLFRKALKAVNLKKSDKVILLGDVIDRGPESKEVLDTIILLKESGFEIICIKGNHEDMLLNSFNDDSKFYQWIQNGGTETLLSFLTDSVDKIPTKYVDLISSFSNYHLHDNFILVHAGLNTRLDDPFIDLETMLWTRNAKELLKSDWDRSKYIIHGHNPVHKNTIIDDIDNKSNVIGIDNGVYLKKNGFGSLSILQLETLHLEFINGS